MPESPDYPNRRRELWLSWPNNPKAENLKARNLKNLLRSLITEEGVVAEVISPNVGYVLIRMNTDESALKVIDVLHGKFFLGRKFCVKLYHLSEAEQMETLKKHGKEVSAHSLANQLRELRITWPEHPHLGLIKGPIVKKFVCTKAVGVKVEGVFSKSTHVIVRVDSRENARRVVQMIGGQFLEGRKIHATLVCTKEIIGDTNYPLTNKQHVGGGGPIQTNGSSAENSSTSFTLPTVHGSCSKTGNNEFEEKFSRLQLDKNNNSNLSCDCDWE